jgi:hypothetical protein
MIRRCARLVAAAFCAALALAASTASAEDVGGPYRLTGDDASGGAYAGTVSIAPDGKSYRLKWDRPAPLERRGYALRLDNVLGVVADDPSADYGIVLYRVKGGHLEGIWSSDPGPPVRALGAENLDGPEGLEGSFVISLGQNPGGSHYRGWVEIKKAGAIYLVDWYTPQPRYIGTGVLMGDVFVVGYGAAHRSGVAAYCLQSALVIEGITGAASDTAIGAEILWREEVSPIEAPEPRLARIRQRGTADCGPPVADAIPSPEPLIVTSR